MAEPKVFISYNWTSPSHCDLIRSYADRLIADGVAVILDQYDLSEGQDKFHFMEKMVTDPTVTHVLAFSDKTYAEKADARKAGVGTESQIMSKEIYEKVNQTNFIPIFCELDERGQPLLPRFFQSRIGIDFSSLEKVNENWERLIRLLHGKPALIKPSLGKIPSYLDDDAAPPLPSTGKLLSYKEALMSGKAVASYHQRDFINAAFAYADMLRTRQKPESEDFSDNVLKTVHLLLPLRDQLIDWLTLEMAIHEDNDSFADLIIDYLERFFSLRFKPEGLESNNEAWFDAHAIFTYELFIYTVAALLNGGKYQTIRHVLDAQYMYPEEAYKNEASTTHDGFYTHSKVLSARNERRGLNRISPVADLIKDRATRTDIKFRDIMEAEATIFLYSLVWQKTRWYPQTLIFAENGVRFPLFIRASSHRNFLKLARIYGIDSAAEFQQRLSEGLTKQNIGSWQVFHYVNFNNLFKSKDWDTE